MHFHDSWSTFPLMVCKSLEHQMSYFCGLNGSFHVLMLQKGKKKKEKKETTRRQNLITGEGGNGLDAKSLDSTSKFYHIWTGNQLKKLAAKDRWMCFEWRVFFLNKCIKEQQQQQNFASVYLLQSSRYPTHFLLLSTARTKVLLNPGGLLFNGLLGL